MMATNTAQDSFDYDPLLGKTVGERYTIERLIGRGGVGLVYLAHDPVDERQVVVKVLAPHWAEDDDAVARFDREALRMAKLDHPNVVKMYDHGHFGGRAYIVMEFIRGEPLRRYLNRRKRLPLEEFIPIASQILLGAGYVHERGIMLRDIKPPNIMLSERPPKANHVKLLDFGLAKLIEEDEEEEITKAHVIGTAAYMSPEQIRGEKIDVRVDVYALGVLFFLMLTGEQPIAGDNDAAVLVNHVHGKPKSLVERLPRGHRIPAVLIELIESCLAKDPSDRPDDASAIAESLFEFIPAAMFELPEATLKTRAPAEAYWATRLNTGPLAQAALKEDENTSAEWTRPLLRRAAKTGEAPLKLAEQALAARLAEDMEIELDLEPEPEPKPKSMPRPKPRSPSRAGMRPAGSFTPPPPPPLQQPGPRPSTTLPGLGPGPADAQIKPKPSTTLPGIGPGPAPSRPRPMGNRPGSATIRVTAADAREAVERLDEAYEAKEAEAESNLDEHRRTGRRITIPPGAGDAEVSDLMPIALDFDDLEVEIEPEPAMEPSGPGATQINPRLAAAERSAPTVSSEPLATEAIAPLASPAQFTGPHERNDGGMRLGIIVAVAGLAALALGGLSAYLVFGGDNNSTEATPPPVARADTPALPDEVVDTPSKPEPAVEEPPATVGTVEVRAVDGARVLVDGEDQGAAPVELELELGEHRIRVTADGYYPWESTIDVSPGANAAVRAELMASPADAAEPSDKGKGSKGKGSKGKGSKGKTNPTPPPKEPDKGKDEPKSDVFMGSDKGDDKGIFLPVGGEK
ncbi:MAG: protein kinase [Deltaproteobacteria bacterium]|nr:protein kinase [Deltaproteobacteria bacterium]